MANILLIDDDTILREMIYTYLVTKGHEVTQLTDGGKLTNTLLSRSFDMIITDLVMPEKEGYEVIMEVKKSHPQMKILAISGGFFGENMNSLETAELLGAHASLSKPFDMRDLGEKIRELGF